MRPNPRLQRTHLRQGYGGQARSARSPLSRQPLGPWRGCLGVYVWNIL
jgi:hypothetical protein